MATPKVIRINFEGRTGLSTTFDYYKDGDDVDLAQPARSEISGTNGVYKITALDLDNGLHFKLNPNDGGTSAAFSIGKESNEVIAGDLSTSVNNTSDSVGRRIRQLNDIMSFREGTAQSATSNTMVLDPSETATLGAFKNFIVTIISGAAAGQTRLVTDYIATTKTISIDQSWDTGGNPDNTSKYILGNRGLFQGLREGQDDIQIGVDEALDALSNLTNDIWNFDITTVTDITSTGWYLRGTSQVIRTNVAQTGSTSNTIVLDAAASSVDDFFNGASIYIITGSSAPEGRTIIDYDGTTKIATVDRNWITIPVVGDKFWIQNENTNFDQIWNALSARYGTPNTNALVTMGEDLSLSRKLLENDEQLANGTIDNYLTLDDDDITQIRKSDVRDRDGNALTVDSGQPMRRGKNKL